MSRIFISYRRDDSQLTCDRIYEYLKSVFGVRQVFRDLDTIPGAADFRTSIEGALKQCSVLLVVIGPQWVTITDYQGRRRLDDPNDMVRLEVETAIAKRIPILPVMVQGALIPKVGELPPSLRQIVFQNARPVRPDPDFNRDMQVVMQDVSRYVPIPSRRSAWGSMRNATRRVVGFVTGVIALVAALFAASTWVNIPIISDFVKHLLNR
ncbi:MAG: hypothetical protein OJF49_001655 [Ktedonobacterales bacterium]|jgi:hypothetical protein|nr:MAG: hypothetical protein OJF49_001655 [Ktedonobacterales bacterium]